MAQADGLYSRIIGWLKILLPLVALAMLSTLFLLSRNRDEMPDMPFAEALRSGEAVQEAIGAPYFAGTTDRGDVVTLSARVARPDGDGSIRAETVEATLGLTDGSSLRLIAAGAVLQSAQDSIALDGGVRIESSTGYSLTTDAMRAATNRTEAETDGPVSGRGPLGTLEAGKLRIQPAGDAGDVHLLFTGGVKLVYEPRQE